MRSGQWTSPRSGTTSTRTGVDTGLIGAELARCGSSDGHPRCADDNGRVVDADAGWERRIAALWAQLEDHDERDFVARVDELVAELPADSAIGLFERGSALDSTGHSDRAVPLYRAALDAGLVGERRRRATIQMASSLRNVGEVNEAIELLSAEVGAETDNLDDAVRAFLALALADAGREREAVGVALAALSSHLPRYSRSVARYAGALTGQV